MSFTLSFFQLITSPTCHGQTRTPTLKCQTQVALSSIFLKMSEEDKEWWKPTRSNKRKRSLGGMGDVWPRQEKNNKKRQKVMKHLSRGNVKLNQESRPRVNAGHKKGKRKFRGLWHHQPTGPQRDGKYSHITWLISMKRQVVSSPANCLWQVCLGVSEICYDDSGAMIQQRRHGLTGPSRRCMRVRSGAAAAPIYTVSTHNKHELPGLGRRYIRINLSLPNIKHRGGVHSIGCEL